RSTGRDSVAEESARRGAGVLVARATDARVRLDGRLDERAWAAADSLTDFRQREPLAGQPASEHTVVKVLRDAEALYVGVRAEDRDAMRPGAIRATQLRRDADLTTDDHVTLLIDSFHDRRSAF